MQQHQQHGSTANSGGREKEKSSTDSGAARSTVDIGTSRRASIMAMLKMSITNSLSELKNVQKNSNNSNTKKTTPTSNHGESERFGGNNDKNSNHDVVRADVNESMLLPPSIRPLKMSVAEYH